MTDPKFSSGSIVYFHKQPNKIGQIISYSWYPEKDISTIYSVYVDGHIEDCFEWDLMNVPIFEEGNA